MLDVMDDMDRQNAVAEDRATAVDRAEEPTANGATASRLLANPRRIRRA